MQSLVSEYKLYLQAVNEIPRKMFVTKFGLITLEIVGSYSILWNVFTFFGEFRSVAFITIGLGYAGARLFFTVKRGLLDLQKRRNDLLEQEMNLKQKQWEQEQRERAGLK